MNESWLAVLSLSLSLLGIIALHHVEPSLEAVSLETVLENPSGFTGRPVRIAGVIEGVSTREGFAFFHFHSATASVRGVAFKPSASFKAVGSLEGVPLLAVGTFEYYNGSLELVVESVEELE